MTLVHSIAVLDAVALLVEATRHRLARGQVGTVVERLDGEFVEVEFSDDNGKCYALAAFPVSEVLPLRYSPQRVA